MPLEFIAVHATLVVTNWLTAIATAATAIVAIIALVYAGKQLTEASAARQQTKDLEIEKSQPYVVVTMEEVEGSPSILNFVIRNYGSTLARDVRVSITPAPQTSNGGGTVEDLQFPEVIPALAPGQQWSTVWDFGLDRSNTDLPDLHTGKATYKGLNDVALETDIILDWSIYKTRHWVVRRGIHDIAEAVREMRDTHKKWTDSPQGSLSIYVRDGEAQDVRKAEEYRAFRERAKSFDARWKAASNTQESSPEPTSNSGSAPDTAELSTEGD